MEQVQNTVDWQLYAEKYDMLLSYNPFYQDLRNDILSQAYEWEIAEGDLIADVGAGTGNYSISLAKRFPRAQIIHIDNNVGMNERARGKKAEAGLSNIDILDQGIEEVRVQSNSFRALVSVHALYTFPDPELALANMYDWLEPGGMGILVDPGRIVNVINWQLAIGWHLVSNYGLKRTLQIFKEAKPVSEQNRIIREMQKRGELWTHSHDEFCEAVSSAGFQIVESRTCFRGLSDMVVVSKK